MIIDIPDEWLKRLLNAHPDQDIKDALRYQFQMKIDQKHFKFYLGDYVVHEMMKQL